MSTTYDTFLPSYYSALIRNQQNSIILDNLYFYVANGVDQDASAYDGPKTIKDAQITLNQVMYGGKLNTSNMIAMIRRIQWQPGKVFARYSSTDPVLGTKDFYCINSIGNVYKCIDNNNGAPSTSEPQTSITGSFQLPDGYIWHYMYKLSDSQLTELTLQGMMPVILDPAVEPAAIPGTVSTIDIVSQGNYQATASGSIQQIVNNNTVRIEDISAPVSGTYNNMGFYIATGAGQGEYFQIVNYTANTGGRFVQLNGNTTNLGVGATYDIAPYVKISGNGSGASARAIMAGTAVERIQIITPGTRYTLATAELQANSTYISQHANVDVNLSPSKGHGGDVYQELYVDNLMINIDFDNYIIANDLPVDDISFCRVGMLRGLVDNDMNLFDEPTFNNTFTARITPASGSFSVGDIVSPQQSTQPEAEVVFANTTHIIGVYHDQYVRYETGNTLSNQTGVSGIILDIVQPEVRLIPTDIITITNVDTLKRDDNSRETLQMLIKVK